MFVGQRRDQGEPVRDQGTDNAVLSGLVGIKTICFIAVDRMEPQVRTVVLAQTGTVAATARHREISRRHQHDVAMAADTEHHMPSKRAGI